MRKKLFILVISSLGLYLSYNLARGAWDSYQNAGRLLDSEKKLEAAQKENEQLKAELQYKQTDYFVEKEAREKLGLAKKGETVIITPVPQKKEGEEEVKSPYEGLSNGEVWLKIFFN